MKIIVALLMALSLTACWDDKPSKETQDYMSNLNKCSNCERTKSFLKE